MAAMAPPWPDFFIHQPRHGWPWRGYGGRGELSISHPLQILAMATLAHGLPWWGHGGHGEFSISHPLQILAMATLAHGLPWRGHGCCGEFSLYLTPSKS